MQRSSEFGALSISKPSKKPPSSCSGDFFVEERCFERALSTALLGPTYSVFVVFKQHFGRIFWPVSEGVCIVIIKILDNFSYFFGAKKPYLKWPDILPVTLSNVLARNVFTSLASKRGE
jgi:hypothetical protein